MGRSRIIQATWVIKMHQEFALDDDSNKKIINKYFPGNCGHTVDQWSFYKSTFIEDILQSYLSHIVQSVQSYVRKECSKPFFKIELCPTTGTEGSKNTFGSTYFQGRLFKIFYPSRYIIEKNSYLKTDIKEVRLGIGHELGHLVFEVGKGKTSIKDEEIFCSLFAIVCLADKTSFYKYETKNINYSSFEDIVRIMSLLHNQKKEKYNVSY